MVTVVYYACLQYAVIHEAKGQMQEAPNQQIYDTITALLYTLLFIVVLSFQKVY